MKRVLTFLSFTLNIILLGAIFFATRKPAEKFAVQSEGEVSDVVITQIVETVSQTNLISQAASPPFDWSAIESEEFSVYAENLRGVGCPEQTVRDILTAEINDLFVHRRQDLFRPFQNQFWDLMAQGDENGLIPKGVEKKLDDLEKEKEALLNKIFGKPSGEKNPSTMGYEEVLADSLSPEKVRQLREVNEKFLKSLETIEVSVLPESEKEEKIAALTEQSVADQKSILSMEELDEFKLRSSSFAQERENLLGFSASEDELRAMAQLSLNEKQVRVNQKSPDYEAKLVEQRAEKEKTVQQMKALLGENRFQEFERSKDSNFRNLRQLGRRYDLSPQTISEVYELARSINEQVRELKKSNVESEERETALETIRQQTERAMIDKLGVRAAETYRRNFNNWDEIPDP